MDNPGFFAILPASVRYDRRLKPAEKIFYAEITSLADKTGCCYASNAYFCPLYDTTERTVQRWVKHLQELGYVAVSYARDAQLIGGTFPRWSAACRMSAPKTTPTKKCR